MAKTKPLPPIDNLMQKIKDCLDIGAYKQTVHALKRRAERDIDLLDALYVLKNGYHEKSKTSFDEAFQAWKYAVRGKTLDELDIRIIVAFDESGMLIITVMHVAKKEDGK